MLLQDCVDSKALLQDALRLMAEAIDRLDLAGAPPGIAFQLEFAISEARLMLLSPAFSEEAAAFQ